MVGYSFYVVLLVLKHVLPGFAMQCWNCLNVTCEQATTASEHKHLSIHGRDHTQTVGPFLNSFSTMCLHLQTPTTTTTATTTTTHQKSLEKTDIPEILELENDRVSVLDELPLSCHIHATHTCGVHQLHPGHFVDVAPPDLAQGPENSSPSRPSSIYLYHPICHPISTLSNQKSSPL